MQQSHTLPHIARPPLAAPPSVRHPFDVEPVVEPHDPLWQLPHHIRMAIVRSLEVTETAQLLEIPEAQVLAKVRAREHCNPQALAELSYWLCRQRMAQADAVSNPMRAKSRADDVITLARHDIAAAVRQALRAEAMTSDEIARRCGTSRESVNSLMAGAVPVSLELVLRMAAVLGLQVSVGVR